MPGSHTPLSLIWTGIISFLTGLPTSRHAPHNPLSTKQPERTSITEYNHPNPSLGLAKPWKISSTSSIVTSCCSPARQAFPTLKNNKQTQMTLIHPNCSHLRPLHLLFLLAPDHCWHDWCFLLSQVSAQMSPPSSERSFLTHPATPSSPSTPVHCLSDSLFYFHHSTSCHLE